MINGQNKQQETAKDLVVEVQLHKLESQVNLTKMEIPRKWCLMHNRKRYYIIMNMIKKELHQRSKLFTDLLFQAFCMAWGYLWASKSKWNWQKTNIPNLFHWLISATNKNCSMCCQRTSITPEMSYTLSKSYVSHGKSRKNNIWVKKVIGNDQTSIVNKSWGKKKREGLA